MLKLKRTTVFHLAISCLLGSASFVMTAQSSLAVPSGGAVDVAASATLDVPAGVSSAVDGASLPDAPGFSTSARAPEAGVDDEAQSPRPHPPQPAHASNRLMSPMSPMAGPFDKYVSPHQDAPRLTHFDKVMVSTKDIFSLLNLAGVVASGTYSHIANGSPNYGTNGGAYGQRLGAAAARDASQSIFSDAILANVLREDPRYYGLGRGTKLIPRVWYAATRTIVTRTDDGRATPNFSLLGGYLGSSAMTQFYYPPGNKGARQVMITYGGSLGAATLGFIVAEFSDDLLEAFHWKRRTDD